jgi:alcohol-forming fatty acyl-CoA reductase
VTASASEPYPGWIDNYAALTGVMTGIMQGTIRTVVAKNECRIDIVPVDMVANTMLVSAANVHNHR